MIFNFVFSFEFEFEPALPDLRFHICNFPFSYSGREDDMVSYERPIWEFVFDRVADLDKKSILLVMYSDLFTARARALPAAKVLGSKLGWIFSRGALPTIFLRWNWEKRLLDILDRNHSPPGGKEVDCLQVVDFNPLFIIRTTVTLILRTHRPASETSGSGSVGAGNLLLGETGARLIPF